MFLNSYILSAVRGSATFPYVYTAVFRCFSLLMELQQEGGWRPIQGGYLKLLPESQ